MTTAELGLETPVLIVYGLLAEDGTAIAGTALCAEHLEAGKAFAEGNGDYYDDLDRATGFTDVSENEAMFCLSCGNNGYMENVSEDNVSPW